MGRALQPREKRGYRTDLEHLERLRKAVLSDERLSTDVYIKIADAVRTIKRELHKYRGKKVT